jgi:hypothetical protein
MRKINRINYQYLHKVWVAVEKGLQALKVEIPRKAKYKEQLTFVVKVTNVLVGP